MTWTIRLNNRKKPVEQSFSAKFTDTLITPSTNLALAPVNKELVLKPLPNISGTENCVHCGLWTVCKDVNKSRHYICDLFTKEKTSTSNFNMEKFGFHWESSKVPKTINKSGSYSDLEGLNITNDDELEDLLSKITSQFSSGIIRDLRVDDSDLPLAKNYVDFWYNPTFVGNGELTYPWPKQTEMALNYLSEWCPKCSDPAYVKAIPTDASIEQMLERIQLLEYGICPKCHGNRLEFWNDPSYNYKRYSSMIGIGGQRGGKTAGTTRINGYMKHRYLKLNRPNRVFGVEDNVWLETCFTATEFKKAVDNFYDPLVTTLTTNKWFKEYHNMLDSRGKELGQELYKILGETTFYNHRQYLIYPKSPDPSNMRGATRICSEIDELSHLWAAKGDDAKKLNPGEVYNVLSNSMLTLRMAYNRLLRKGMFDVPPPIMCNITSPRSIGDFAMRLYRLSQDKESNTYGWHYNLYEMNPYAKNDPEIEQIKRERPEDFKRDFMAIPPSAHNAFIENKGFVTAAVLENHKNGVKLTQSPIGGHSKNVKLMSADFEIKKSKAMGKKFHSVMALDAGTRFNSFAFCIGHLDVMVHDGYETTRRIIDAVGEIIPENDRTISIADVYNDVINPLIDEFNVIHISADRWNSAKLLGDAYNDYGIEYKQYSCKMKDFIEFRTGLISGDIKIPLPEIKLSEAFDLAAMDYPICMKGKPVAHAMVQMLTVENYIKTVEKGGKFTDDIFRAMVLANHFLTDDNLYDELVAPVDPTQTNDAFVGAIASGGGAVIGLSGGNIAAGGRSQSNNNQIAGIGGFASLPGFGR